MRYEIERDAKANVHSHVLLNARIEVFTSKIVYVGKIVYCTCRHDIMRRNCIEKLFMTQTVISKCSIC